MPRAPETLAPPLYTHNQLLTVKLYRNDLTSCHEAINARLNAAEIKAHKLREEEIQKNK